MGSRVTVDSLARGGLEYIRVRDMGWRSCRSRFLNSPDTVSWRVKGKIENPEQTNISTDKTEI